jgi:formate hydrogenlyase subunit 4
MGYLLIFVSLFIILLVENSRIPFDDPNTHLELTMIHEVIILDHSGPLLGIMEIASYIKHFIFASLIVNLLFPFQTSSTYLNTFLFYIEILIVGILVGITESVIARVKLRKIPTMQMLTVIFAGLGMFLVMK